MKVTAHQINPEFLEVHKNIDKVISKIQESKKEGAQLIVFPELTLTGYFVGESYHKVALKIDSDEIKRIIDASKDTAVVVGFIEESKSMNFYNSALIAVNGKLLYTYRKVNLPNYGAFEERKIFSSGKKVQVFKINGFNIAVLICNDLWHPSIAYLGAAQKADIFVTLFNSSEGSIEDEFCNIQSWEIINKFYSRVFGVYNIAVNRVGEEKFEQKAVTNGGSVLGEKI
jgi:predicted amidohydrolase